MDVKELLSNVYPAPEGVKVIAASSTADKMLSFWSIPNKPTIAYVRAEQGGAIIGKAKLTTCPGCGKHLHAQLVRLSERERAFAQAFAADAQEPEQLDPAPEAA